MGGGAECCISKDWCPETSQLTDISSVHFNPLEAENALKKNFQLITLDGLGIQDFALATQAAGGLLAYLHDTKPLDSEINSIPKLDVPSINYKEDFLILDSQTRRNLELTTTQRDNQFHGSFLWAIDRTLTAMGGRCLRQWLEAPLMHAKLICERQEFISTLVEKRSARKVIRKLLRPMGDLERIAGRAGAGQAGARDLIAIADGLERLPKLAQNIKGLSIRIPSFLKEINEVNPSLIRVSSIIRDQLINNPPLNLSEGGLIHDGVDPILDGLRNQLDDQESWLSNQEEKEKVSSKNYNLKLQYHRTFGYFFSVSKAKAANVPDHWIRRQTLANEERFITPDLKAREGQIFQLKARTAQREYELFCKLRDLVGLETNSIRKAARAVAGLDAMAGLADLASSEGYCKPKILIPDNNNSNRFMDIKGCRHPVVEQILVEERFTPNNIKLGKETELIILTGPNASGKSCFLRQIGLIQLLAQIGSWVPAEKAEIGLVDRIFTRVGAVDDLAAGQSTFIVEMADTANILNNATKRSLVLLDEIGRGTSTFDGLSIAWAVSEHLANKLHSRTIFATHYHELNDLSKRLKNVKNFQVLVQKTGKELIFLHQIKSGGASQSYGIEAARLAGVPNQVLTRARTILNKLETEAPTSKKDPSS